MLDHRPTSDDAAFVGPGRIVFRIRVGRGFARACRVVVVDKYRYLFARGEYAQYAAAPRSTPMHRQASDAFWDVFEAEVEHTAPSLFYHFVVDGPEGEVRFGNGLLVPSSSEMGPEYMFTRAAESPSDAFWIPEWAEGAITYQVFADAFHRGSDFRDPDRFDRWDVDEPHRLRLGGTLRGIREKLLHLRELAVDALYLTPIFTSASVHRYDWDDPFQIDPDLGTEADLVELVTAAHEAGIRVILDAVLHSSGPGFFAFRDVIEKGPASEYADWYTIYDFPVRVAVPASFEAWGYNPQLPKLNLANPDVREFLHSVLDYWVKKTGIDGWRIDSCDEVASSFLIEARRRLRARYPDLLFVAESWTDASPWLDGRIADSAMNYPFRDACVAYFARRVIPPSALSERLGRIRAGYRPNVRPVLWNLIESHDTGRFLAECGGEVDRLELAAVLQYTYPGAPYLYYGTEMGMERNSLRSRAGMVWDPDERGCRLRAHYRRLGGLRRSEPALRKGSFEEVLIDDARDLYGFVRRFEGSEVAVIINRSDECHPFDLPFAGDELLGGGAMESGTAEVPPRSAQIVRRRAV